MNTMLAPAPVPTICGVLDMDRTWWGAPEADWTMRMDRAKQDARLAFFDSYGRPEETEAGAWRRHLYEVRHHGGCVWSVTGSATRLASRTPTGQWPRGWPRSHRRPAGYRPASRSTATGRRAATSAAGQLRAGRECDQNHDQADRLVQDDGRERGEAEEAGQQWQRELHTARTDHPAQNSEGCSRAEHLGRWVRRAGRGAVLVRGHRGHPRRFRGADDR
ncbi:hypothetical protein [Streptomyces wedmorensis]